jgi:ABC-type dipeptide/oligopeptide/nickel transport system permease subunit
LGELFAILLMAVGTPLGAVVGMVIGFKQGKLETQSEGDL